MDYNGYLDLVGVLITLRKTKKIDFMPFLREKIRKT